MMIERKVALKIYTPSTKIKIKWPGAGAGTRLRAAAGFRAVSPPHAVLQASAVDEQRAEALRADAGRLRAGISQAELKRVQAAAAEANRAIDGRTFSWTGLLNEIEATLPNGVMLTAVHPALDDAGVAVNMVAIGRSVDDIGAFMDRLEQTGSFYDVLSTSEQTTDDGGIQSSLTARYRAHRSAPAASRGER